MDVRWMGAALALGAAPLAEAAVVTVTRDVATLRATASGCADLRDPLTFEVTGQGVCAAFADEDAGSVLFGARTADAGGAAMQHPWGALASTQVRDGALEILLRAITGPASGTAACPGAPCRVREATAAASVSWSAAFAISGGAVTLRRTEVPPGFAPFDLQLRDLTLGTTLDPRASQWSLADGHGYALEFVQTKAGRDCTLDCTSLAAFLFGSAQLVDARPVPEPGGAALYALGLAATLLWRRPRLSRSPASR
jgi:hypothetical protein